MDPASTAILEAKARTSRHRDLRQVVLPILPELARFGRIDGGTRLGRRHTTIWRWVQRYGPEVLRRLGGEVKRKSSTWHMDETFVRIAGNQMYLFRAVDSHGETVDFYLSETRDREAAKLFLQRAMENPDNPPPGVFARDGLRSYPAAIRELKAEGRMRQHCRQRTRPYCNNRIESDHRHIKRRLRAMQGPRTTATAWAAIQGIEAANMIRKGQVLGISRSNLHGQAWLFGALLGAA